MSTIKSISEAADRLDRSQDLPVDIANGVPEDADKWGLDLSTEYPPDVNEWLDQNYFPDLNCDAAHQPRQTLSPPASPRQDDLDVWQYDSAPHANESGAYSSAIVELQIQMQDLQFRLAETTRQLEKMHNNLDRIANWNKHITYVFEDLAHMQGLKLVPYDPATDPVRVENGVQQ